jgi:hypothetical protein
MAATGGCASDNPQPVSPAEFYARPRPADQSITVSAADRPGILHLPDARAAAPPPAALPSNSGDASVAEYVRNEMAALSTRPTTAPVVAVTQPTTEPVTAPELGEDEYLTLGGVVAIVNGRPIYAEKVLRRAAPALRSYAKQMGPDEFQVQARQEIEKEISVLGSDELEIALAERSLDPKDVELAKGLTAHWAEHEIEEAGGSEQTARLRAHQSGEEFQDQEEDKYYSFLTQLYYYRKIDPDIDVTETDERRYYTAHIDEFTTPAQANIVLIEADPAQLNGDNNAAIAKLKKIRDRALAGEDLTPYARNQNDLPGASGNEGNGGQMNIKAHSFALANVDAAIWKTPVGHVSDVIEDGGAYYLVKVLSRDDGGTKSFADAAVQQTIYRRLASVQRIQLRDAAKEKLEKEGVTDPDPNLIQAAVDMAMQNYSRWAKE